MLTGLPCKVNIKKKKFNFKKINIDNQSILWNENCNIPEMKYKIMKSIKKH